MIRSYRGQPSRGEGQVDYPAHLAVDSEGHVFVTDSDNNRVLVLDSTLSLCKVISCVDDRRVYSPCRLHYSVDTHRLMVGLNNGVVDVYSVVQSGTV